MSEREVHKYIYERNETEEIIKSENFLGENLEIQYIKSDGGCQYSAFIDNCKRNNIPINEDIMELRRMAAEHIEQNDNLLDHLFNYVTTDSLQYHLSIKINDVIQNDFRIGLGVIFCRVKKCSKVACDKKNSIMFQK
jgi:hypothetical protein